MRLPVRRVSRSSTTWMKGSHQASMSSISFGGQAERVLLIHRRDIVEPIEIGNRLQVGLVLDQLLGAAMQQADMRIDPLHHLAVELQHQPQHAMRGGMLWSKIDGEVADGG